MQGGILVMFCDDSGSGEMSVGLTMIFFVILVIFIYFLSVIKSIIYLCVNLIKAYGHASKSTRITIKCGFLLLMVFILLTDFCILFLIGGFPLYMLLLDVAALISIVYKLYSYNNELKSIKEWSL